MARSLSVEIVGDASDLQRAFRDSEQSADRFNRQVGKTGKIKKAFGGAGKAARALGGTLAGPLMSGFSEAFEEMKDAQKVSAQTAAVLKSTGGAAGVTAKEIDDLSGSLGNMSGVDDEAIKSGQNLLLTFTNVKNEAGKGNDVFNQATKTMLDMSTALGTDAKGSAIQLGKALNDPVKGIKALSRVGVTFTAGQKKQIEAMVDAGNTMGAQKLILQELNKEFGGSAKAAGDTLAGKLDTLKNTALNLGATLLESLSPQITAAITSFTEWATKSENQKQIMDTLNGVVTVITTTINILKTAFEFLSNALGGNRNAVIALVAAYATFKVLTIASTVGTLAGSMLTLTKRTRGATGAAAGLKGSLAGKAGLVGAAGVAAFGLTTLILKVTGLDQKLKDLGATIYDTVTKLGLMKDPMAEFAGKAMPTQSAAKSLRGQANTLRAGGMTPQQAAARLKSQNPRVAGRDIDVYSGVTARSSQLNVSGGVHLHGVTNTRQLESELHKRSQQRPHRRRGS